jgi:hypothetical protein
LLNVPDPAAWAIPTNVQIRRPADANPRRIPSPLIGAD